MEFFLITTLNGLSYGLLLFMLSSGLTITLSLMGVLNFAHASFYMVGAYVAYIVSKAVGLLGALVERYGLRRVHKYGPIPELLLTLGIAYLIAEGVKLVFGLPAVPYRVPAALDGPMFSLYSTSFPTYRGFMMGVLLFMLLSVYLLIKRTRIGLVIQAALTHPDMVEALGHNVPRLQMLVFGGMGSLAGAFLASILIGLIQTFAITPDYSMLDFFNMIGAHVRADSAMGSLWKLKISQVGPVLPFLLLVLVLIFRPRGLLGTREA
ncbi:MAG: branched-chain amino acid ABC transporter permease [Candidatus Protistobacter heckmanni]|nr:branched-chain amino acid ABC transporter permease [Candidatus Protistobacter heckmanni]